MFKLVLFGNIGAGAGVCIIITLTLLGGGFALISPSTVTATPSNTTSTTTTPPPPPSAVAAQQIINNTQTECEEAQFLRGCVMLVYESPTTVVLNGEVSIFGGSAESRRHYPNLFIWNAVDDLKAQGYTITTVEIIVGGNKSSDNDYHVIMSK